MGAPIIQVEYDQLAAISERFGAAAELIAEMSGRVGRASQHLERSWLGDAATAFSTEMERDVRPALGRLVDALGQSQHVSREIGTIMRLAEQEAAALFHDWYDMGQIGSSGDAGLRAPVPGAKPGASFVAFDGTWTSDIGQTPPGADPTPVPASPTPVAMPTIVSRKDWGAREPNFASREEGRYDPATNTGGYASYSELRPGEELAAILDTIVIHHAGNGDRYTLEMIQSEHMDGKGWSDIGYHYIVAEDGTIYEGRDLSVRGTHVEHGNTGKVGILFLGDYEPGPWVWLALGEPFWRDHDDKPTAPQIESAKTLISWLDSAYGIDSVVGHNDLNETECPGDLLERYLPELDAAAQAR